MSLHPIEYAALCVIVPTAWGLIIFWATTRIEKRALRSKSKPAQAADGQDESLPLDYNI